MEDTELSAAKKRLLFVSPTVPATTGSGAAMRAAMLLRALAQRYEVSLIVIPLYGILDGRIPNKIAALCRRSAVVSIDVDGPGLSPLALLAPRQHAVPVDLRLPTGEALAAIGDLFPDRSFDVVHVFSLLMVPFARSYLDLCAPRPAFWLDIDNIESLRTQRLAELYRLNGDHITARFQQLIAHRIQEFEDEWLQRFDRIYVCSEHDRDILQQRASTDIRILPNAVTLPSTPMQRREGSCFTFLFVGTLGYYPNDDAMRNFSTQILPLLREAAPNVFQLNIVGVGPRHGIEDLAHLPEVRLIGAVPDVGPYYAQADAVTVPIRAGGGTRIKILEAFSYRRPVVTTSMGIEGIAARDGEHVLVADTPDAFAERCVRLMTDRRLAERLTRNAFALLTRSYTAEAIEERVAALP